jgi:FAD/FMN-containing dehydrogenase
LKPPRVIHEAIEDEIVHDAVIAQSEQQAAKIWGMRDLAVEVDETLAPHISFDVSLRIAQMEEFVSDLEEAARLLDPSVANFVVFGHVGDGNLHLTLHSPEGMHTRINDMFYGLVRRYGGSISAEHGVGMSRIGYLGHTKSEAEIGVMRKLKLTLDPLNALNPGRMLPRL